MKSLSLYCGSATAVNLDINEYFVLRSKFSTKSLSLNHLENCNWELFNLK